ncbi:MAG: hypothetical protein WCT23_01820 [Candidatus Neomarinimicrobiota bacterium]
MSTFKDNKSNKLEENKANWAKIRKMGKTKFILIYGVLFWGLIMAIAFFFFNLRQNQSVPWYVHLLISLSIFTIAGYFVGHLTWKSAEKKYHEK